MKILKYINILKFRNLQKKKNIVGCTLQKYFDLFFKTEFIKAIIKQVQEETNLKCLKKGGN